MTTTGSSPDATGSSPPGAAGTAQRGVGTVGPAEDEGLADRVAIVTGGGAVGDGIGNGRAAALLLARAGCRVLVVDRQGELAGSGQTSSADQSSAPPISLGPGRMARSPGLPFSLCAVIAARTRAGCFASHSVQSSGVTMWRSRAGWPRSGWSRSA